MLVYIGGKEREPKHADKQERGEWVDAPSGNDPFSASGTAGARSDPFRSTLKSAPTVCAELPAMVEPGTKFFTDDRFSGRHIHRLPYTHHSVKHCAKAFAR